MNRTIALIAACLLSAASSVAQAQSPGTQLKMDTGFYIGAGLGRSETRDFCTSFGGACDAKDMTWNLFAGYQFNRHLALEVGYSNFGEATSTGFVGGVPNSLKFEATAFELVGVGLLPLNDRFTVYGKIGFFRYDADGTSIGAVPAASNDTGTELTFGVGAEYAFARAFIARLEWQRYLEVGNGLFASPKADISVLRLGARYRF